MPLYVYLYMIYLCPLSCFFLRFALYILTSNTHDGGAYYYLCFCSTDLKDEAYQLYDIYTLPRLSFIPHTKAYSLQSGGVGARPSLASSESTGTAPSRFSLLGNTRTRLQMQKERYHFILEKINHLKERLDPWLKANNTALVQYSRDVGKKDLARDALYQKKRASIARVERKWKWLLEDQVCPLLLFFCCCCCSCRKQHGS